MASLHAWRGDTLPEQREALYANAVDLLLDQWESQKLRRLPDGTYDLIQPSLAEWLRVDQQAMRQALNRLAFEVHRDQPALVGTADIAEEKLVPALLAWPGILTLTYVRRVSSNTCATVPGCWSRVALGSTPFHTTHFRNTWRPAISPTWAFPTTWLRCCAPSPTAGAK
jgi:hypothetical protein